MTDGNTPVRSSYPGSEELLAKAQAFVDRKYVARADERQKSMGLAYVEAERRDLAREIARFAEPFIANAGDMVLRMGEAVEAMRAERDSLRGVAQTGKVPDSGAIARVRAGVTGTNLEMDFSGFDPVEDVKALLDAYDAQGVPSHIEKTEAGIIDWKMEVERLNRLLRAAEATAEPDWWRWRFLSRDKGWSKWIALNNDEISPFRDLQAHGLEVGTVELQALAITSTDRVRP